MSPRNGGEREGKASLKVMMMAEGFVKVSNENEAIDSNSCVAFLAGFKILASTLSKLLKS